MKSKTTEIWLQDSLEIGDVIQIPGFIGRVRGLKEITTLDEEGELVHTVHKIVRLYELANKQFSIQSFSIINYKPATPEQSELYYSELKNYLSEMEED